MIRVSSESKTLSIAILASHSVGVDKIPVDWFAVKMRNRQKTFTMIVGFVSDHSV
jgi:hypothetical protein